LTVIYRGPARELTGDSGKTYKRGVPTELACEDAYLSSQSSVFVVEGNQPEQIRPKSCCS
jgi:hypothetical protein